MTIADVLRNAAQELLMERESTTLSNMETGELGSLDGQVEDLRHVTELGYYE